MDIVAFICVWLGCIVLGWVIPYIADPRHDVEWAFAAGIGMLLGAVLVGPLAGYWTMKLVRRRTSR